MKVMKKKKQKRKGWGQVGEQFISLRPIHLSHHWQSVKNEEVWGREGVANIREIRKSRLRYFSHASRSWRAFQWSLENTGWREKARRKKEKVDGRKNGLSRINCREYKKREAGKGASRALAEGRRWSDRKRQRGAVNAWLQRIRDTRTCWSLENEEGRNSREK